VSPLALNWQHEQHRSTITHSDDRRAKSMPSFADLAICTAGSRHRISA
jgi:hypothetical protein